MLIKVAMSVLVISFFVEAFLFFLTIKKSFQYLRYMKNNHYNELNKCTSNIIFLRDIEQFTYVKFIFGNHFLSVNDKYVNIIGSWLRKYMIIYLVVSIFMFSSFFVIFFTNRLALSV